MLPKSFCHPRLRPVPEIYGTETVKAKVGGTERKKQGARKPAGQGRGWAAVPKEGI